MTLTTALTLTLTLTLPLTLTTLPNPNQVRLEGAPASLLRNDAKGDGTSTAVDAYGRAKYIVDSGTSLLL